jgi:hypothetical protein
MSENPTRLVVAIDGPAGAGKSTAAKLLAQRLGYALLDTGAIYRTLALLARREGIDWGDGPGVARLAQTLEISFAFEDGTNHVFLRGADISKEIRVPEISDGASRVSALPGEVLPDRDRRRAGAPPGRRAAGRRADRRPGRDPRRAPRARPPRQHAGGRPAAQGRRCRRDRLERHGARRRRRPDGRGGPIARRLIHRCDGRAVRSGTRLGGDFRNPASIIDIPKR